MTGWKKAVCAIAIGAFAFLAGLGGAGMFSVRSDNIQNIFNYTDNASSVVRIYSDDRFVGTGFFISDKEILTSYHVVEGSLGPEGDIEILLYGETDTWRGVNFSRGQAETDLAVLSLVDPINDASPLDLSCSDLPPGAAVFSIGTSGWFGEQSFVSGSVSAVLRWDNWAHQGETQPVHIFDMEIMGGQSGSPIFNDRGQVVSVATAYLEIPATMFVPPQRTGFSVGLSGTTLCEAFDALSRTEIRLDEEPILEPDSEPDS